MRTMGEEDMWLGLCFLGSCISEYLFVYVPAA